MKQFYKKEDLIFLSIPLNKKFKNLANNIFTKLTILGYAGKVKKQTAWYCECECGNIVKVLGVSLRGFQTTSCGCIHKKNISIQQTKHGHTKNGKVSSVYRSWSHMLNRCNNPKNHDYYNYGARGIKVCDRWLNSFENFLEDMGEPVVNTSIDRINVNGNYELSNCRWATKKEQSNNTRRNIVLTFNNESLNITQWAERISIPRATLSKRIQDYGWSIEDALTVPVKAGQRHIKKEIKLTEI